MQREDIFIHLFYPLFQARHPHWGHSRRCWSHQTSIGGESNWWGCDSDDDNEDYDDNHGDDDYDYDDDYDNDVDDDDDNDDDDDDMR